MKPLVAALLFFLALPVRTDFALSLTAPAWAGWNEGVAAFDRGDYATALREWRPLAERGDAEAQAQIGFMYFDGQGVPQDYAEAAKWFRTAAGQGNAIAQAKIGFMYYDGQGVPQDYAEAAKWFRKAAEQGDATAQAKIGFMYTKGRGVPQDYAEAFKWYRRAADQRIALAQAKIGDMYFDGQGVPQDYAEAVKWFRKAADQGIAVAQFNLGGMYANGQGVPQDYGEAAKWLRKAAEQGHGEWNIDIELNKVEDNGGSCLAWFVVQNNFGHTLDPFSLDLFVFDRDGIIARQVLLDLAPLGSDQPTVAEFRLIERPCAEISWVLINDIPSCQSKDTGETHDCVSGLTVSSRSRVELVK